MKSNYTLKTAILFVAMLYLYGCSKSSNTPAPKTTTPTPTTTDLLVGTPWKISTVEFQNGLSEVYEPASPFPDSLKSLVLTFKANNTFTETGGKTASGTWIFAPFLDHVVTLTTTSAPASKIDWTYKLSASSLELSNNVVVTYISPIHPLDFYQGEKISFTH